jgi:hypothetical protein
MYFEKRKEKGKTRGPLFCGQRSVKFRQEKKGRQTTLKINSFVTLCLSMWFLNSDIRLINDVGLLSSIFLR